MLTRLILAAFMIIMASGCATRTSNTPTITLPMIPAWYNGTKVFYITTDISDKPLAEAMGANYVPRLEDAIPPFPKPPTLKTVLERVYVFPNKEQSSVFASAPQPLGPGSLDRHYSPLWILYEVQWNKTEAFREIKDEEQLFAAQDRGWITITRTEKIVNCPIVMTEDGKSLGTANVSGRKIDTNW